MIERILIGACVLVTTATLTVHALMPAAETMEYRVEAQPGDTVWSICSRIATNKDDLSEVVWRAMHDSGIKSAADLQPGDLVIVKVKPVA